jgi:hypothetical protein
MNIPSRTLLLMRRMTDARMSREGSKIPITVLNQRVLTIRVMLCFGRSMLAPLVKSVK